jgi:hypothetical protein
MYNALFESIIRTSGADTDDIHSGDAEGNFWTENQLFEAILREAGNILSLVDYADDIINTLNNLGKSPEANKKDKNYLGTCYSVCEVTDLMKKFGTSGTKITISYDKIKEKHYGMGLKQGKKNHLYTADFLKQVCQQLSNPVIIAKYITKMTKSKTVLNFYLNLKIDGKWTLTGIEIDPNYSSITTIFGDDLKTLDGNDKKLKYVQYVNWNSSPNTDELINLIDEDTANPEVFK